VWGYHPQELSLYHQWVFNAKPHAIAQNIFKYIRIEPELRNGRRMEWNRPRFWPLAAFFAVLSALCVPAFIKKLRKNRIARSSALNTETGRYS